MKTVEKELSIEKIKELLGNKKLSDETINKIMIRIKRFCKVAYELYSNRQSPTRPAQIIQLSDKEEVEDNHREAA